MTQAAVAEKKQAAPAVRTRDLEPLFCPRSIAVVGASRNPGTVGHELMRNLVYGGYTGIIYPVNPKARSVLGIRCIPSVSAIGEAVDLVVVAVGSQFVEGVVREAADAGTKNLVIITAGFKEIGAEGLKREQTIKQIADERGLNIVGPNCLGIINTDLGVRMNAAFGREMPLTGPLGLISQSGALASALQDYAEGRRIGFSRFVSFGNKCDLTEVDLLRAVAADPHTKVIVMYVEDISDGPAFIEAAQEVTRGPNAKPILAIKTGRTAAGAAAAASHTGSLAGSDEVYDALMAQAGVIRVESVGDLFDLAEAFADPVLPRGRRTAIVTNAGGPGIMATDATIRAGLTLSKFQEYTLKSLRFQMPPTASLKNPVDVIGDARHDRYRAAMDAVVSDEGVDQVVVLVTPQTMTDVDEIAKVIKEIHDFSEKPIVPVLMGLKEMSSGNELLRSAGIPTYAFPENALHAVAAKNRFAEWVSTPLSDYRRFEVDQAAVKQIFAQELREGRNQLVEVRALEVLRHYGFPLVPFKLATSADEAVAAASEMGYPVVMKISGPKILHKSDVGGVKLRLANEQMVREAYDSIMTSVRSKMGNDIEIWGVVVQKMLPPGKEMILGMSRHGRLGPLLMFGLGGIYTEVLKDVSFRVAPIRENVAMQMVKSIRAAKLLEGVRGEAPSDISAIADALLRLSQLVTDHPEISELDINPLLVYPRGEGAMVADARIILSEDAQ